VAPDWCIEGLFVLLLDLDRFCEVNDRLGYAGGDRLLIEVAARLRRRLRPTDTAARFGPDEFAILLAGVPSGRDVARVAERLLGELEPPVAIDGRAVKAAASIGVAMGTAGERPEDVVRNAERALSRAQLLGRSNYQIFQSDTAARETSLQQVETALRRALDQEEFRARFRPTVLRKEGSVASFEVLLWRRAPGGADELSRVIEPPTTT
jgi:diguanylate cyclase (GGDEF)-like protein